MSNKRRITASIVITIALLRIWFIYFMDSGYSYGLSSILNTMQAIWIKYSLIVAGIILFPIDKKDK